ncbi:MAG: molybdopterin molybdotransferase MoeA [Devosia sp.]|nr:molybdopterin molybdotransferase MoeA [Devosia sp.]
MAATSAPNLDLRPAAPQGRVIAVDIAAAKALSIARPVRETEHVPLFAARGRVLARAIRAPGCLPVFDNSAMDGYALRLADLAGDGPWELEIGGRLAAGDGPAATQLAPGTCLRIFTGAPVPSDCDAVVMQERCVRDGNRIVLRARPRHGENIRRSGEDVRQGQSVLQPGDVLRPLGLALLAGLGLSEVEVLRKVRIGLVSTGTELRNPGEPLAPGQIYNSNRVLLGAMLAALGWAAVIDFGIVADRPGDLATVFGEAARCCDVVISTGGASAGDEDHVVTALDQAGGVLDVVKVAMRPGKPLKIGRLGDVLFAGLPGNPNATLVTFQQIALPAIRRLAGLRVAGLPWMSAVSGFDYAKPAGRTEFVPVRETGRDHHGRPVLEMLSRGSSANLSALALADGVALLPPDAELIAPGDLLSFQSLGDG